MKQTNYLCYGLFLIGLHLKCSGLGLGPSITWFEVYLPLLLTWLFSAMAYFAQLFKIDQKVELFILRKVVDFTIWRKRVAGERLIKKIYRGAKK